MSTTSPELGDRGEPSRAPVRDTRADGDRPPIRAILRMRTREGCEQAFESSWRAAAEAISRMPGNVRQELIRDVEDPRTFIITSDWTDAEALDAFGRSAARDRLTAALRDLRESADRHTCEILHVVTARGPRVRVVVTVTVPAGQEAAYERAYLKVAERMRGTPGHIREELLREPGTGRYHIFAEWEDERSFNAWVDDPSHMDQTGPLMPYLLENFERKTYHISVRPEEALAPAAAPAAAADSVRRAAPTDAAAQNGAATIEPPPTRAPVPASPAPVPKAAPPSTAEVLVVGAGPTGLTVAIELARRGIACQLIDKRREPAAQADKAIGIHCRTMEIWEDIGVVRQAMDAGIWLQGQTVFVNGRQTHQVDWDLPELPYAHLGLPQYETERILTEHLAGLAVRIDRGTELAGFSQDDEGVTCQLVDSAGQSRELRASYLVGCDGAHSTVRDALGLTFEGGMGIFPQLFMLGDVDVDWQMPERHLLRFMQVVDEELKGMLVCVPLRGPARYRVATLAPPRLQAEIGSGVVPPGFWQEYTPPTLEDIQRAIGELAPAGTTARNLRWSSIFRIKHGIVDRYRVGRVFVAGDAAHLHPPAGGQGMNTGIQDGWNLGWKLALAVRGRAAPGLLDSYEGERRPAGKAIVDRAVRVAFTDEMDMDDEREQFLTEMGMRLTYRGSPIVGESTNGSGPQPGGPGPGDRAPDAPALQRHGVGHPLRLFELTRGTAHTLLLYADALTGAEELRGLDHVAAEVGRRATGLVNTYLIVGDDAPAVPGLDVPVLRDSAGAFRDAYAVTGPSVYLIRPDGHVSFRGAPVAPEALSDHLRMVLV